eukprot:Trichotokara_eunicae@DN7321_c0_g1_i1.p1
MLQSASNIVIALGSNLGNRPGNLMAALTRIQQTVGPLSRLSFMYQTYPAYVPKNDPTLYSDSLLFLNSVVQVKAPDLGAKEALVRLRRIEEELGG